MKSLLAAAVLAITGAVTVQAADIFTCGGLGNAMHDGKVERVCTAPVTTHWTKLGHHSSALVYYINEPDDLQVVVTTRRGERLFDSALAVGQSAAVSIPRAAGEPPVRIMLSNAEGHLHISEPPASATAQ